MKKITLSFLFTMIALVCSFGQRMVDVIANRNSNPDNTIVHRDLTYLLNATGMQVYDGHAFQDFPYPAIGGLALVPRSGMLLYNDAVYITLSDGFQHYITRFDHSFAPFALTHPLESNLVVFNGRIHVVLRTSGGVKLFSFDGSVLREVASSLLPNSNRYTLTVAGSYLYINGIGTYMGETSFVRRYDGIAFSTIGVAGRELRNVEPVGTGASAYLTVDERIYLYTGTTISLAFETTDGRIYSEVLYDGALYFRTNDPAPSYTQVLYKLNGITLTRMTLPADASLIRSEDQLVRYRGELHVPLKVGSNYFIYRFNGTTWTPVYTWGVYGESLYISERAGKLIFYRLLNDTRAVEYDGFTFEEFFAPAGIDWFIQPLASTSCYHLWSLGFVSPEYTYRWVLGKELFNEDCVSSSGSSSVIPGRLGDFEHIVINAHAPERDWCWTGIDVDWVVTPICIVPPCIPPFVQATLTDINHKTVWEKAYDKPFQAALPVADQTAYALSVAVAHNKQFSDVLRLDNDLVNKGFRELALDFYPKNKYFFLKATTDKDQSVPFSITLRNEKGESLWEEKLTAPLDKMIQAFVPKGGDYLQLSSQESVLKSNVSYYPNPFAGKLTLDIAALTNPVAVSVSDLQGKVCFERNYTTPGQHVLDLGHQKQGLYVIIITDNSGTRRELIQFK